MTEMPYLCWAFLYTSTGVNSYVTTNDNYMARSKERFGKFKGVTAKKGERIGVNATILPRKVIKEGGAVATGSVVTKDVEKEELVAGVSARKLRNVPEDQLLRKSGLSQLMIFYPSSTVT
ncbi:O-acetyltransferase (cell wall biosynthesis), partial [Geobacillus sp. WSUCF1]